MQQFNTQILPIIVTEVPGQFTLSVGIDTTNPRQYTVVSTNGYGAPIINVCHYSRGQWVPFYSLTGRLTEHRVANVHLGSDVSNMIAHLSEGAAVGHLNLTMIANGAQLSLVSILGGSPTVVTVDVRRNNVIAYFKGQAVLVLANGQPTSGLSLGHQELNELQSLLNPRFGGGVFQNFGQAHYGFGGGMGGPQPMGGMFDNGQPSPQHYQQQQSGYGYGAWSETQDDSGYRSAGPRNNAYSSPETLLRTIDAVRFKSGEFAAVSESDSDSITGLVLEVHSTNDPTMHRITLPVGESQTIVGYIPLRDGVVEGVLTTGNYVVTPELCKVLTESERSTASLKLDYQQTTMGYDINVVSPKGVVSVRVKQQPSLTLVDALYSVICNWDNVSSGDKPITEEQYAILTPAIINELHEQGNDNLVQVRTDTVDGIKYTVHMYDGIKQITAETTDLSLPKSDKFKAVVKLVCVDVEPTTFVDLKTVADLL